MEIKNLKTLLIVNPNSGTLRRRRSIPRMIISLQKHFSELEIAFTRKGGDASKLTRSALQQNVELIICAGGDGTINEVANELYGTPVLLGILPIGTGNGLAREIGLSMNPGKALNQILNGKVLPLCPALLNEKKFFLVSGAGYDAFVAYQTDHHHPRLKKTTGFLSFIIVGILIGWRYPFHPIIAQIDGKSHSCYGLLVMKAKAKMGPFTLAPSLSLQDGQMGVFLFKKSGIWNITLFFLAFLFRVHLNLSFCPFLFCNEIVATSKHSVPVQYDGETTALLPSVWRTSDKHILMIYPKGDK